MTNTAATMETPEAREAALDQEIATAGGLDLTQADELSAVGSEAPPAEPPAPISPEAPPADPDDFDAVPSHETLSDGRKRVNRIPHDRVAKMIEKARVHAATEYQEALRAELGLPAEAPLTAAEAKQQLSRIKAQATAAQQDVAAMQQVEALMLQDPEAFLASLARVNPAYGRFLGVPPAAAHEATSPLHGAPQGRPEPDLPLPNGQRTYSVEGLSRLLDWQRQQAVADAEARVAQRYAPLEQHMQAQRAHHEASQRVQALITDARTWPGFTDHESGILAALQANPRLTLDGAYRQVVIPKLATDRAKVREEVLAEIAKAPTSTASKTTPPAGASAATLDQEMAAQLKKILEGGGA